MCSFHCNRRPSAPVLIVSAQAATLLLSTLLAADTKPATPSDVTRYRRTPGSGPHRPVTTPGCRSQFPSGCASRVISTCQTRCSVGKHVTRHPAVSTPGRFGPAQAAGCHAPCPHIEHYFLGANQMSVVEMMCGATHLSLEEAANILAVNRKKTGIVYGPLKAFPLAADLVLAIYG
jgi:hypothetical protein